MSDTPIELVEYDPGWPDRYEAEEKRLVAVLGRRIERVEHVGSTAVPGLPAEPVVDIAATVEDWDGVDECDTPLRSIRYERVPGTAAADEPRRYYEKRPADGQAFDLRLRPAGSPEFERRVRFRDHLRENSDAAARYERLKRHAAEDHPDDRQAYAAAKTEFVESVLEDAPRAET